jgi:hypothetical protein
MRACSPLIRSHWRKALSCELTSIALFDARGQLHKITAPRIRYNTDAGPKQRASLDVRHAGRRYSDGVIVAYPSRETRDLLASASVFVPTPRAGFASKRTKSKLDLQERGERDWNRLDQGRQCLRPPWLPRGITMARIFGPHLNNCLHSVERHSTAPMLLSSRRIQVGLIRFPRAAIQISQLYCFADS